jgi:hypothetical protein
MKIFLGYGFNGRDTWVKNLVFPIIQAFGDEALTGEELFGEQIPDAVRERLRQSHACIGFLTQRSSEEPRATHRWVIEEMATALSFGLRVVEVRETGVDEQFGIMGDRQRISYDQTRRDECLVALVRTVGNWHSESNVDLRLLPEQCANELFPLHAQTDLVCTYRLRIEGESTSEFPAKIEPVGPSLIVKAKRVPRHALVQVKIRFREMTWLSSFQSVEEINLTLQRIAMP